MADFYWNYTLVNSSNEDELFEDCRSNFECLFLKQLNTDYIVEIDLHHGIRIGMDVSSSYLFDEPFWISRHYHLMRDHVQLFTSYTLSNIQFFISYLNFVSVYDVISKTYIKHFEFNHRVMRLFRTEKSDFGSGVNLDSSQGIVLVHLENDDLAIIDVEVDEETGNDTYKLRDYREKLEGTIKRIVTDTRDFASHFISAELKDKKVLYGLKQDKVFDVTKEVSITPTAVLVKFISQNKEEDFGIFDYKTGKLITYVNHPSYGQDFALETCAEYEILNYDKMIYNGFLHTAVVTPDKKCLVLVDKENIYKYEIEKKLITNTLEEQNIENLQVIDEKYIYALMNRSTRMKRHGGFYFMNIESILEGSDEANTFRMKRALVG